MKNFPNWFKTLCCIILMLGLNATNSKAQYCTPGSNYYGNCYYMWITNVGISGTSLNNSSSCDAPYVNYSPSGSTTGTLLSGSTYTLNMTGYNYYMYYSVWIDLNQDNSFDYTEQVVYNYYTYSSSTTFSIPAGTTEGNTRMRVRADYYGVYDPCYSLYYGETEDYTVTITAPAPCSGTPTASYTTSTANPVCSQSFTLGLSQGYFDSGITFQWQSSTDGSTYTDIGGANSFTYTTTESVTTYYQCVITCTNSGQSTISTPVQVIRNAVTDCYCIPGSNYYSTCLMWIDNVTTTGGLSNFDNATSCEEPYVNFSASKSASQYQGSSLTMTFHSGNGFTYLYSVWVDYNDDGNFDYSEQVINNLNYYYNNYNPTNPVSGSFTIPETAPTGNHRMRVRGDYTYYYMYDACSPLYYGETEDYTLTVVALPSCSGTPDPGNTLSSASNVCPTSGFTLSFQNEVGSGSSYQWQSSTDGSVFNDIGGANSKTYSTTQSTSTYYRCNVTCTNSGQSNTSNPLQVTMNPPYNCYCASASITTADEEIYSVTVNGATNAYACGATAPGPGSMPYQYSNFYPNGSLTTLTQMQTVSFSVEENECDGYYYYYNGLGIWIDYNQNGVFDEPSEKVYVDNTTYQSPRTINGSFTVPLTAATGLTGMRFIVAEGYYGSSLTPCLSYYYGETEDYLVMINPTVACSGTPAASTTVSTVNPVCATTQFTLNTSPSYVESGLSFQWQSSSNGSTWSDVSGANGPTLTTTQSSSTYYQLVVTCANGGSPTTSTPLQVVSNAYYDCYCIPPPSLNGACYYMWITNVATSGGVTDFNNTTGCSSTSFTNYSATQIASQLAGSQVNMMFSAIYNPMDYHVWVDYNDDGFFDGSELVLTTYSYSISNVSGSFTIPSNAPGGTHRMRVRGEFSYYGVYDPCAALYYGETEDYGLTVIVPTPCTGTPNPGNTLSSASTVCSGVSYNLSLENFATIGSNITYQWQSSTDGSTYTDIGGANNPTYTDYMSTSKYYQCVTTCTNSGQVGTSNPILVSQNTDFCQCASYCTSYAYYTADEEIYSVTVNGVTNSLGCGVTAPGAGSIAYSYSNFRSNGSLTSIQQGQTISFSVEENECDGYYYYANGIGMWIDYNQNGSFSDANEAVYIESSTVTSPQTVSGTFTVPVEAVPGSTALRVIAAEGYSGSSLSPCIFYYYGETEDYCVTITPAPPCASTPTPGNTISSAPAVCSSDYFTLSLENPPAETGISYQWQSSSDGSAWTDISGANSSTYSTYQSQETYYQCKVTCDVAGTGTSNSLLVTQTVCYCTTPYYAFTAGCGYGIYVSNFTFGDLNNSSGCNGVAPYYNNYTGISGNVTGGQTYSWSASIPYVQYYDCYMYVWIDLDNNGSFEDAGEAVYVAPESENMGYGGGSSLSSVSGTFTIPLLTTPGAHRIRVRCTDISQSNSCTSDGIVGEVEDYTLMVTAPPACDAAPDPSATVSSRNPACSGQDFTLSLSTAYGESGLAFQWESSSDGSSWTPISGANDVTYTTTETTATYYHCVVTCTTVGQSITSTDLLLTVDALANCYCVDPYYSFTAGCGYNIDISNFTFVGINNTTGCNGTAPYYTYYDQTASVVQNNSYSFSVSWPGQTFYSTYFSIWIDFNDNGSFEDAGEKIWNSGQLGGYTPTIVYGTFNVGSSPVGTHRLRVRCYDQTNPNLNSCTEDGIVGETEDYNVAIYPQQDCSGTPDPGATLASATSVCPAESFTVSIQNAPPDLGLSYQWQWSTDGNTYFNIPGSPNASYYTLTQSEVWWYQCLVSCSNSGESATSTPVFVGLNNFMDCYCSAGANVIGCNTGDEYISNYTFNSINNNSTCPSSGQYSDFTSISTTILMNQSYDASVRIPNWFGGDQATVWIDFNHNGSFYDSGEQFNLTNGGGNGSTPLTGTISIPSTATPGNTIMRVRGNYSGTMDPCGNTTYGEVEDYTVNIVSPDPSWSGLDPYYCIDASAVVLTPVNPGGVFTGPGVIPFGSDYYFDPSTAGVGGPYTITYTIGDLTDSKEVSVYDLPTVTLDPYTPVCTTTAPFEIFGGSPAGGTYFIDGYPSSSFDPGAAGTGDHDVIYSYTDQYGCGSFAQQTLTVNQGITATITPGPITECHGVPVTLEANTYAGTTYQWYKGNNPVSGAVNSSLITTKKGSFYVIETLGTCSSTSSTTAISRIPSPPASVIVYGSLDICNTGQVLLRANGGVTSPYTYQWYKGGNIINGAVNRYYTATGTGDYSVAVTNTNNCTKTSASVTVYSSCKDQTPTDLFSAQLNLYPNPTNGEFVVQINLGNEVNAEADIQIVNTIGQSVYLNRTAVVNGKLFDEVKFDGRIPAGNYFVRVIVGDKVYTGQIIYQR